MDDYEKETSTFLVSENKLISNTLEIGLATLIFLLTPQSATAEVVPVYSEPIPPYIRELQKYDWDSELMYKIMMCESGGNPNVINKTPPDFSVGLMQINIYGKLAESRPSEEWLKVPENNIKFGYEIWKQQGYNAWKNCYNKVSPSGDKLLST